MTLIAILRAELVILGGVLIVGFTAWAIREVTLIWRRR